MQMFCFGKRKNKRKEKVIPRDNSPLPAPRSVTGICIIERLSPPPAPFSHADIANLETQLPEEFVRALDSVEPSDVVSSNRLHKAYLQPDDNLGFVPSKPAAAAVTKVLRHKYTDAWLTWREVPYVTRQILFNKFQESYKTREVEHITQATQEGTTPLTPRQLWMDLVGVKKGRIYGLGSSFSIADIGYGRKSILGSSGHGMQAMLHQMRQEITQEIRQEVTREIGKEFEERERRTKKEMKKMMRDMMCGELDDHDDEDDLVL